MILDPSKVRYIVIHCSATGPWSNIGAAEIDIWHRDRGWSGIGYHEVVRRSGVVEAGRSIEKVGAHVRGFNRESVGICLVGGVDRTGQPSDNFTSAQKRALYERLIDYWIPKFPSAEVVGHRDLSPDVDGDGVIEEWEFIKACPSFDVREWLEELRNT